MQKFDDVLCDIVQLSHAGPGITLQLKQKTGDFHPSFSLPISLNFNSFGKNCKYASEIFECIFLSTAAVTKKNDFDNSKVNSTFL